MNILITSLRPGLELRTRDFKLYSLTVTQCSNQLCLFPFFKLPKQLFQKLFGENKISRSKYHSFKSLLLHPALIFLNIFYITVRPCVIRNSWGFKCSQSYTIIIKLKTSCCFEINVITEDTNKMNMVIYFDPFAHIFFIHWFSKGHFQYG